MNRNRREFLANVGSGMLVASVGSNLAQDLGLAPAALADGSAERLSFGPLEPLVSLMQETPIERFLPAVIEKMKAGTGLRQLVAAAALANARTFGGQDYEGYHAIMALAPAYLMCFRTARAAAGTAGSQGPLSQHEPHPANGGAESRGASPGRSRALARTRARARVPPRSDSPARHEDGRAGLCRTGAAAA